MADEPSVRSSNSEASDVEKALPPPLQAFEIIEDPDPPPPPPPPLIQRIKERPAYQRTSGVLGYILYPFRTIFDCFLRCLVGIWEGLGTLLEIFWYGSGVILKTFFCSALAIVWIPIGLEVSWILLFYYSMYCDVYPGGRNTANIHRTKGSYVMFYILY